MCGICGKLNFDPQEPADTGLLQQMMDRIQHRGPDGHGLYAYGPIALGHRRLSIIDLSTGDQPMCNEDGTVWVVYNGEIYNFPELRLQLEGRGHTFKSTTDTEVIVHLYEELGEESVARLRGMFAFALWDNRKQLLLLARDRVGIKPLYYTNTGKAIIFGSEIKSLIADPSVERRVNKRSIDQFLTYYYLPGCETLFEGIAKLDPGHYLIFKNGHSEVKQYWDLEFPSQPKSIHFEDAVTELRTLLRRTVKDHMISDVPVGVLLSGGVDSTGVLRYAAEETSSPIYTFTIGFDGHGFADERPFAQLAAKRYGTFHQDITMRAEDFRDFLPEYVWHMEEPVCEPPAVALYFVARLARQSAVKVLLSGEGGDEAFGGYQNYRNLLILENLKSTLGSGRRALQFAFRIMGMAGWKRVESYANLVEPTLAEYYLSRTATPFSGFNPIKKALYKEEFKEILQPGPLNGSIRRLKGIRARGQRKGVKSPSILNQMLYVDTKTWLPDDLLVKADKMTMATSVELRVPLLDFQVLEFAASLPQHYKVSGLSTKRILKAALAESVPREILNRKKTGFPVPYENWIRNDLRDFFIDTIIGPSNYLSSYFEKEQLIKLIKMQSQGANCSKELFCLLVLELWHRKFLSSA